MSKLTYASTEPKRHGVRFALPDCRFKHGFRLEYRFFDSVEGLSIWLAANSHLFFQPSSSIPIPLFVASCSYYNGYTVFHFHF